MYRFDIKNCALLKIRYNNFKMLGWWSHLVFKEPRAYSSPWRASWNSVHFSGLESSSKGLILFGLFCFRKTDAMVSLLYQKCCVLSLFGETTDVHCPLPPWEERCIVSQVSQAAWWCADLVQGSDFLWEPQVCQTPFFLPGGVDLWAVPPQSPCHKVSLWKLQATEQDLLPQKFTSSGPEDAMVNRKDTGERQEAERAEFNFSDKKESVSPNSV